MLLLFQLVTHHDNSQWSSHGVKTQTNQPISINTFFQLRIITLFMCFRWLSSPQGFKTELLCFCPLSWRYIKNKGFLVWSLKNKLNFACAESLSSQGSWRSMFYISSLLDRFVISCVSSCPVLLISCGCWDVMIANISSLVCVDHHVFLHGYKND